MSAEHGPVYVFIGSSTEGMRIAEDLHDGLEKFKQGGHKLCDVTVWDEVFKPSDVVIDRLLQSSEIYDYAILVLTPDDYTTSRGKKSTSPRDNVNLEAGLFMAKLGRRHCILVRPKGSNIKMASDLAGLCCVEYEHAEYVSGDGDLRTVVNTIRRYIEENGYRDRSQSIFRAWGYDPKTRAFAASLRTTNLQGYSNGKYSLLIGCFGGEDRSRTYITQRIALSEAWPIPKNIPSDPRIDVDCSSFSSVLKPDDIVWGVLFLLRGEINHARIKCLRDIIKVGGRMLDSKGHVVDPCHS